ncbi:MAG: single-stranded-DNA-specific exonuclease RecJ [Cyanobacteriota bacterium]|nr:single-stranded-DNA-specific exonuclease RecJ [Cyanobacteriota bacterium]
MSETREKWQIKPQTELPESYIETVKNNVGDRPCLHLSQLLWQRGIKEPEKLAGFLNPELYPSASPFEFGEEIKTAVERIVLAFNQKQKVAIWGDFDADGITSTSVLWEGLGEFFPQKERLTYYIPNRITESHGLNFKGIDALAKEDFNLIITCDTGSTNIEEIEYARGLGIDLIVTDHHTLPAERPPVVAIVNPRYLPKEHPMYHLSGVAVAYKLIEALYQTLPEIPQGHKEDLLDLVAIGLIADLVELSGDCRYLAQMGIKKIGEQLKNPTRPGVAKLLSLCKKTGDRPTDISFGIGPRINAVSRIMGDASFCVELLTNPDPVFCEKLALETELANTRRKSLQKNVAKEAALKLNKMDLSTTRVIVLSDPQWPVGVLGLVAAEIAREYCRPAILLTTEGMEEHNLARGSARSVDKIDLYELVQGQAHLLHRFGGHPFAAGLSLAVENIPLFADGINQQLGQTLPGGQFLTATVETDLIVTVSELGQDLFRELKLIEPCGMGNPVPQLLIKNCWFRNPWHQNQKDLRGNKISYIKTDFEIFDESSETGFPGIWWGHYKDEIPSEDRRCDAAVELDFNTYKKRYEVRLVALRPCSQEIPLVSEDRLDWILDWRNGVGEDSPSAMLVRDCPTSWENLRVQFRRAFHRNKKLAIAYSLPPSTPATEILQKSIGIAKYLSRTGRSATRQQLLQKLGIGEMSLKIGFKIIKQLGFNVKYRAGLFHISFQEIAAKQGQSYSSNSQELSRTIEQFLASVREEQFRRKYFNEVPVATIKAMAARTVLARGEANSADKDSVESSIPF